MEGLAGITNWKDETEDQARFRKAMNEQVEWVLEASPNQSATKRSPHLHRHCTAADQPFPASEHNLKDSRVWLIQAAARAPQYLR